MSLRSVVKSKVRRSNSRESHKCKKKSRHSEGEYSSDDRSRSRDREDLRGSPEKKKGRHSEDGSGSDEATGRDRKDRRENRRARKNSDDRYSSGDQRKRDRDGEDGDRREIRSDVENNGKRSNRMEDEKRNRVERNSQKDDRSREDKERERRRQRNESSSRNVGGINESDRLKRDDERRRRSPDERSNSRHDNNRSGGRDDGSRRSNDRSSRNNERSLERASDSRSKRDERSKDASEPDNAKVENDSEKYLESKRVKPSADGDIVTRTGGAYIPPARLRMMQAQITDKASAQYQRIAWEALKKSINGLINKVNVSNLPMIVRELLQENIVRGRGLLARSIMQAQAASPTFTHVYAALVAVINTKFPNIGELIVKRLIVGFKKGFRRNEKATCLSSLRFIAHLFNQLVCHEVVALQVLMLLVAQPTDDSVEVAVGFLKECGNKLKELSPKSLNAVFESLRTVLHEATIDKRVQYMIEVMFAIRKDGFKDHPSVISELDLVEEDDQYTHVLKLDDPDLDPEDGLNVFKFDPLYLENEEKYKSIKKEHLDEGDSDDEDAEDGESGEGSDEDDDDDDEEEGEDGEGKEKTVIIDSTETNLVAFRRTLYLTIQSSLDFEECAHKIRKMDIKPGQEDELCNMILDCCAQQRTYEKFFGLLAQRFCMMEKKFMEPYQRIFQEQYDTVHRLETNKLRNVAKFYAHLLYTDAIEWKVLECIRLNEDDTTSSGRIFIKILFQELSEYMGLSNLNDRLKQPTLQMYFEGLFPRDNPRNTRFAINFFTSIGLGGLTDELRDHLKSVPRQPVKSPPRVESSSSESSSEDESESSEDESSSSPDSEHSLPVKKRRREKKSKTPEKKSHKSDDRRKLDHSQKSEKYQTSAKSSQKSDGPTSMQLRLMKLASYGQPPVEKDEEKDEEKERGREKKRDEDTRSRGQEVHAKQSEEKQGRRRGQDNESESDHEKEQRKGKKKQDKDKREDKDRGHKGKRKHVEDSESDGGQKRTSKRSKDGRSSSEGDRRGRVDHDEGRGRERSGDRTKERQRRPRSRS